MESQSHGNGMAITILSSKYFFISGWLSLKYLRHLIYFIDRLWDIWNIWDILFGWLFAVSAVAGRLCLQSFNLTLPPYHHYRHLYWTSRHHHFRFFLNLCMNSISVQFIISWRSDFVVGYVGQTPLFVLPLKLFPDFFLGCRRFCDKRITLDF